MTGSHSNEAAAGWHRQALALWPASVPVLMALAVCDPPWEIPLPGLGKEEVEAGRQLLRSAERAGLVGTAGWDGDVLRVWPLREDSTSWLRRGWIPQAVWEALGGRGPCVAACLGGGDGDAFLGVVMPEKVSGGVLLVWASWGMRPERAAELGRAADVMGIRARLGLALIPWAKTRDLSRLFGGPVVMPTALLHDGVLLPEG